MQLNLLIIIYKLSNWDLNKGKGFMINDGWDLPNLVQTKEI